MSVPNRAVSQEPSTEADRQRLVRERILLAEAREAVAKGHVVPDAQVDSWLDRMVDDEEPLSIPGGHHSNDRS